jgi:hypothetical protein
MSFISKFDIRVGFFSTFIFLFLTSCQAGGQPLPTLAALAMVPTVPKGLPATFTPLPPTAVSLVATPNSANDTLLPTATPAFIPTITPYTPRPSPTRTPTPTSEVVPTATPVIKAIHLYGINEVIPYQAFPTPAGNNGWGMHWIPTVSQDAGAVDRFVGELVRMHIKWVVFLNDGDNTTDNNYLVEKLVANHIMPVMRIYRSNTSLYDGDIGGMVAHYRAKGVYYYQIYNEPNVNVENGQGFANPNQYAERWAAAAQQVVANGGLPAIGAFSPGGEYNHNDFLDRTLRALEFNGDAYLLNHAWLSVHNYHGTRPYNDPGGFLLFRRYNEIVESHIGRSLPMIGTEGGSYSSDRNTEKNLLVFQYSYMRDAEPYFLVFSSWLLANSEGGARDATWEWQALFQPGFVHPVVTDFFYNNSR